MLRSFYTLLLINLGYITPLIAEEVVVLDEELQELLTLDVADLTTISVSVASKHDERVQAGCPRYRHRDHCRRDQTLRLS